MSWPTRYVCPILVLVQYAVMRALPGRPARIDGGCLVQIMPAGHGVEVELWWPESWILAECRLWNSRPGVLARAAADLAGAIWRTERDCA